MHLQVNGAENDPLAISQAQNRTVREQNLPNSGGKLHIPDTHTLQETASLLT